MLNIELEYKKRERAYMMIDVVEKRKVDKKREQLDDIIVENISDDEVGTV